MATKVFVSRLRHQLDARGLTVAELRRRLEDRGVQVSRGTLDRMVSSDPIDVVHLRILVPVLDELDLDLSSAFARLDADEATAATTERATATDLARHVYEGTTSGDSVGTSSPDANLRASIQRSLDVLRQQNPALYASLVDRRGRLRRRALTKALQAQLGGIREGKKADFISLTTSGLLDPRLLKGA